MPEACRHLYLKVVCLHAGCTPTYDGNLLHRHGRLIANFRNSEYHAEYLTGKLELARIGFYRLILWPPIIKRWLPASKQENQNSINTSALFCLNSCVLN